MKLATVLKIIVAAGALVALQKAHAAESTVPKTGTTTVVGEAPAASPMGWLQMPKITMPTLTMPKVLSNPLAPFKAGAKKVTDGTKRAWEGTKEIFHGGDKAADGSVSRQEPQPSMWKRMFGGGEKPQDDGPQTIAQFMAQPRPE